MPVQTAEAQVAQPEATATPEAPPPAEPAAIPSTEPAIEPTAEPAGAASATEAPAALPVQGETGQLPEPEATALPAEETPAPAAQPRATPLPRPAAWSARSESPVSPPAPLPTPESIGPDAITVEALTSDHEARPAEPHQYRFQLTNTTGHSLAVMPSVVNSLDGWTGEVLRDDGARLDGAVRLGPWQSSLVVVAVTVPADARVGDRNRVSLEVTLANDAPAPEDVLERPEIAARDPEELMAVSNKPGDGIR